MKAANIVIIPATLLSVLLALPVTAAYVPAMPDIEQKLQQQIERQMAEKQARRVVSTDKGLAAAVASHVLERGSFRVQLPPAVATEVRPDRTR